jgi:hypothetical protein
MTSQAAAWNSPAMNSAWVLMSLPLMFRTGSFLIIAVAIAILLHLLNGFRIGGILVHCDGARVHRVRLCQCLAEEPFRRLSVALGRQQKVDRLAACALSIWPPLPGSA